MNDHPLFPAVPPEDVVCTQKWDLIPSVLHLTTSQQIATSFSLVFKPTVDILLLCLDSVYWSFWFLFVFPGVGFFFLFVCWFCILLWYHVWKLDFGLYCGRLCPLAVCLCAHLQGSLHTCLRLRLSFYKNGAVITGPVCKTGQLGNTISQEVHKYKISSS